MCDDAIVGPLVVYVCPGCDNELELQEIRGYSPWELAWCPTCEEDVLAVMEELLEAGPRDSERVPGQDDWPQSVDEAVDGLLSSLPEDTLDTIEAMDRGDLISLHFTLGPWVRNAFGLWRGNRALLDSCADYAASHELRSYWTGHPDDASSIIVEALWLRLQEPESDDALT